MGNDISYYNDSSNIFLDQQRPLFSQFDNQGSKYDQYLQEINVWQLKNKNPVQDKFDIQDKYFSKVLRGSTQEHKEFFLNAHYRRSNLMHQNLVQYYGSECKQRYELTINSIEIHSLFEYPGKRLNEINDHHRNYMSNLSEKKILDILHDITSVLSYLHQKEIIHGDLQPHSIFIDKNLTCKIIENGLVIHNLSGYERVQKKISRAFLSPEQLIDLSYSLKFSDYKQRKSDIYALGMTILETMTLQSSFDYYNYDAFTINETLIIERIQQLADSSYSQDLLQLVISMLQRIPQKRPNATILLQQIQQAQQNYLYKKSMAQEQLKNTLLQKKNLYMNKSHIQPINNNSGYIKYHSPSVHHRIQPMNLQKDIQYKLQPQINKINVIKIFQQIYNQQFQNLPQTIQYQSHIIHKPPTLSVNPIIQYQSNNNNEIIQEKFRTPPHNKQLNNDINAESIQKIEELSMKADRALMNSRETIKKYNL